MGEGGGGGGAAGLLKLIRFVCLCLAGVWETAVSRFSLRLDVRHNASHIQLSLGGRRRGGGPAKGVGGGGGGGGEIVQAN